MAIHAFCTHQKQLTYITAAGHAVVITGTLLLDSDQHPELVKELTAIANDSGSPIFLPMTDSEVKTTEAEDVTQRALIAELTAKAAAATIADKKGR
jgi:hypothetical protein